MSEIRFTSEITAHLLMQCGGDTMVLVARQVSTEPEESLRLVNSWPGEEQYGRIRHALRMGHSSCFEHGLMTVALHAPAFVWWEWVRHRFHAVDCPGLSPNLESGRYRELEPVFWVPKRDRKMVASTTHRPARPDFVAAEDHLFSIANDNLEDSYREAWSSYGAMLLSGIANEVARAALGFGIYYSGVVSANPLAWLHFLSKRTHEPAAKQPSYPQAEIEDAARQVESAFARHWPLTYRAWQENGRMAP